MKSVYTLFLRAQLPLVPYSNEDMEESWDNDL